MCRADLYSFTHDHYTAEVYIRDQHQRAIDRLADAFAFPLPSAAGLKRIAVARNIVGYRLL